MTEQIATDFEVLAFFPADHATVADGKVYANGGFWNQLNYASFPQEVPLVSLVAVLLVPFRAYHQDHKIELGMEDADGQAQPLRVEGAFRVGAGAEMRYGDPTVLPIAVSINNLRLEKPGDYTFTLAIDGSPMERYPFRAVQRAFVTIDNLPPDQPDEAAEG